MKSARVGNSWGVREAATIAVSVFGGGEFGEVDGMENCCSKGLQFSLG